MESVVHLNLCRMLKRDMESFISHSNDGVWSSGTTAFPELPNVCSSFGYKPDLKYTENQMLIAIGDAKISSDIQNNHTYNQLDAYIKYMKVFKTKLLFLRTPSAQLPETLLFLERTSFPKNGIQIFVNKIKYFSK